MYPGGLASSKIFLSRSCGWYFGRLVTSSPSDFVIDDATTPYIETGITSALQSSTFVRRERTFQLPTQFKLYIVVGINPGTNTDGNINEFKVLTVNNDMDAEVISSTTRSIPEPYSV